MPVRWERSLSQCDCGRVERPLRRRSDRFVAIAFGRLSRASREERSRLTVISPGRRAFPEARGWSVGRCGTARRNWRCRGIASWEQGGASRFLATAGRSSASGWNTRTSRSPGLGSGWICAAGGFPSQGRNRLVPVCGLLVGVADGEDSILAELGSHDLQADGHSLPVKAARNRQHR